ncbi:hypothetical protein HDU92_000517 [Lobulomyces angularis]|nr:hypothetical protein HDU92_000517 [Lobulomyces angularis]
MFGITTLGLILPILYLLLGMENSTNSEDNVFDFIKSFGLIMENPILLYTYLAIIILTAVFAVSGISVTRRISATSRSVIDSLRTVLVYIICLILQWETFNILQVFGFILILWGTLTYNNVINPPFCFEKPRAEEELIEEI